MRKQISIIVAITALACFGALPGRPGWQITDYAAAINPAQSMGYGNIYIDRQTSMDPVSIEKIAVGDQLIELGVMDPRGRVHEPGMQFQAGPDWLKDMSVVLKNRTNKEIVHVEIELWFPDSGDGTRGHPVQTYELALGQRPEIDLYIGRGGQKVLPDTDKEPLSLLPEKTVVIHIADYFDQIEELLKGGSKRLQQHTRVVVRQLGCAFVDGMRWSDVGGFLIPDFDHPGHFAKQDQGRFFPGNPSKNWPPANAPGEPRSDYH
jgi:hypothetical protein